MSLWAELKRRNVIRVAVFYLLAAWLVVQVAETVLPVFGVPEGVLRGLIVLLALGFVPTLLFAWIYELTPEGLKRESQLSDVHSISDRTGHKLNLATLVVAVLAVALMAWDRLAPHGSAVPGTQAAVSASAIAPAATATDSADDDRASVAVLAFENMSTDPENLYFAEGISEEILNVLAGIDGLKVASRTSAFSFKGSGTPIPEIADKLDVAHVLEGSVRKSGTRVRITAQLIEAATDAHLWSESYDRELTDIFRVQDEIAGAIVAALKLTLTGARRAPDSRTDDVEAYSRYLKGRFFWHQRTVDGFVSAERELRRAVELDSDYADAWAALADVYVLQPEYGAAPAAEAIPKARAAIGQALALDPDSARALASRGYLRYQFDWDWAGAEADFRRAIALDPAYATAHQWYAEMLAALRRSDEALVAAQRAVELDPLAPVGVNVVGLVLWESGRPEQALLHFEQALELAPDWPTALSNRARVLTDLGRLDESRAQWLKLLAATGIDDETELRQFPPLVVLDVVAGRMPRAQAVDLLQTQAVREGWQCPRAGLLAALDADEPALDQLEQCVAARDPDAVYINSRFGFERLRTSQRFQSLLEQMNFPAEARR